MRKTILVLGGGTGGVVAATILGKTLGREHKIVLLDKNRNHLFLASLPLLIVGLRQASQITRPLAALQRRNIHFLQAEILGFDFNKKQVQTNKGDLSYDYAVIALGCERHPQTVARAPETAFNPYCLSEALALNRQLQNCHRGELVLFITSFPFSGAIAPYELIFLLDAFFCRQKRRRALKLTLVTPESLPLGALNPLVGQKLQLAMQRRGIEVLTQARPLSFCPRRRSLLLEGGLTITGDIFIGIPSHWCPQALRQSQLAGDGGWVEVNPHSLATKMENVYALGDCTGLKLPLKGDWIPKVGFFAHYQAEVVARNIALQIRGKNPSFSFRAKAAGAAMLTSFSKGRFLSLDASALPSKLRLSRESRFAYLAKTLFEKYWLHSWL